MPTYRGPKSVLIQPHEAAKAIAYPVYDHQTREYVVVLSDELAADHGHALIAEGMREVAEDDASVSTPDESEDAAPTKRRSGN